MVGGVGGFEFQCCLLKGVNQTDYCAHSPQCNTLLPLTAALNPMTENYLTLLCLCALGGIHDSKRELFPFRCINKIQCPCILPLFLSSACVYVLLRCSTVIDIHRALKVLLLFSNILKIAHHCIQSIGERLRLVITVWLPFSFINMISVSAQIK